MAQRGAGPAHVKPRLLDRIAWVSSQAQARCCCWTGRQQRSGMLGVSCTRARASIWCMCRWPAAARVEGTA